MKTIISYRKNFNEEGTVYRQMIRLQITEAELNDINLAIQDGLKGINYPYKANECFLHKGINYTKLTIRDIIAKHIGLNENKRFKDENTIFKVEIIQPTALGIPNTIFVYHGDWANPEIIYKGKSLNYYSVEDYFWEIYKEQTGKSDENGFLVWMKAQDKVWLTSCMDEIISNF